MTTVEREIIYVPWIVKTELWEAVFLAHQQNSRWLATGQKASEKANGTTRYPVKNAIFDVLLNSIPSTHLAH